MGNNSEKTEWCQTQKSGIGKQIKFTEHKSSIERQQKEKNTYRVAKRNKLNPLSSAPVRTKLPIYRAKQTRTLNIASLVRSLANSDD